MKYAHHVAAVLATAPRPTAEALDVIAANLAKSSNTEYNRRGRHIRYPVADLEN